MADDEVRLDPALPHRSEECERRRDERRLLDRRVDELLLLAVEAQPLEVEAARLAAAPEDPRADGYASAMSRPIPASIEPWPGKQNAILLMPRSPSSTGSARCPT